MSLTPASGSRPARFNFKCVSGLVDPRSFMAVCRSCIESWASISAYVRPYTCSMIRCSKYTVNPSFSQKSFHVAFVTRLPDQEWASSCATRETRERSPARIVGVAKVSRGFSMPPNGKLGGRTITSYRSQRYGPYSDSAALIIFSVSSSSHAALSTMEGSAYTPLLVPVDLNARSPTASARRYEGIGWGMENSYTPSAVFTVGLLALMTAIKSERVLTRAL